jgi:hypothetical protein
MVNPGGVSDPAWRLLVLARRTALIIALVGLISGAIGTFLATRQSQHSARWQSVLMGSAVALVVLFGLSAMYDLIAFIMRVTGGRLVDAFLPAGWPYAAPETGTALLPVAQAAAQTLSYLGLAAVALGAALWGAAPPGSRTYYRGRRGVAIGAALLAISVGGVLFATIVAILLPIL